MNIHTFIPPHDMNSLNLMLDEDFSTLTEPVVVIVEFCEVSHL
jgi:hypothetical protein